MQVRVFSFFLMLGMSSCGSLGSKDLGDFYYKRDMLITVDGVSYEGVAVLPEKPVGNYKFTIEPRKQVDLFTVSTCAKIQSKEEAWKGVFTKIDTGFWDRIISDKKKISFEYSRSDLERSIGFCRMYLEGLEKSEGLHSWGYIDFQDNKSTLPAWISCNDKTYKSPGVSACQIRKDMWMAVTFEENVKMKSSCNDSWEGKRYEFQIHPKECIYRFIGESGRVHRLVTLGWEQQLNRN